MATEQPGSDVEDDDEAGVGMRKCQVDVNEMSEKDDVVDDQ